MSTSEFSCQKCKSIPENYIKLDCDHKFCLLCLGYVFYRTRSANLMCPICESETELDPDAINALELILEEIIKPYEEEKRSISF